MKTLHRNDWANLLKMLAAILAAILGTIGAQSYVCDDIKLI